MASKTQTVNMALFHLGSEKVIGLLDTEKSAEARAGRTFFDIAVDDLLSKVAWPFATRFASAELVVALPNTEWGYSYRYPSDCLVIRRVLSGLRNDSSKTKVPFKVGDDSTGKLFWCDEQDAIIEYTKRIKETFRFNAGFTLTLSYYLAYLMAPSIAGNSKTEQKMYGLYERNLMGAENLAFNEQQDEQPPESIFITGRN